MPNEPKFSSVPAEVQDDALSVYPGSIPSTPIIWPTVQHNANQIQQTKGSAKPQATGVQPTTLPNQSTVAPRTTPAHVSNVRVVSRNVGGQKNLTVQFNHPSGDPYFSGAKVYLRQGNQEPVLVASGSKSPLTFTATNNSAPHSIFVTSVGNWGETDVMTSPSAPVKLLGPLNVSKVPGIALAAGGGGSPAPPPSSVSDGLIHGDLIWDIDSAYSYWRDDFRFVSTTTGISSGTSFTSELAWTIEPATGGSPSISCFSSGPPFIGGIVMGNAGGSGSTANSSTFIVPTANQAPSAITREWDALFEHPNWKMVWQFALVRAASGTTALSNAFSMAQTSWYVGLANVPSLSSFTQATSPRLPVFVGLRYDTDTTAPSIADSVFVFEAVCNSSSINGSTRNNTQGNTSSTGIVPTEGHFYRLEMECTAVGAVVMTLTDSIQTAGTGVTTAVAQYSATITIPLFTCTNISYQAGNGMAYLDPVGTSNSPFTAGSIVTVAGTGASGIDGANYIVLSASAGTSANYYSAASFGNTNASTATMKGYPAVFPFWCFGNSSATGTLTINIRGAVLDFAAFIWNPGVGGFTTPAENPLLSRYF